MGFHSCSASLASPFLQPACRSSARWGKHCGSAAALTSWWTRWDCIRRMGFINQFESSHSRLQLHAQLNLLVFPNMTTLVPAIPVPEFPRIGKNFIWMIPLEGLTNTNDPTAVVHRHFWGSTPDLCTQSHIDDRWKRLGEWFFILWDGYSR